VSQGHPVRVVRVIARLNVGGPAIQAITLTSALEPRGYVTTLARGSEAPEEGSMDYLAQELSVRPQLIPGLRRDPGLGDPAAFASLVRLIGRERPAILHTHAAKAGTLGRLAALALPPRRRPLLVHTFHGHSLRGYFSGRRAGAFLRMERFLARRTERLVAVSEEVRDELVALGVGGRERFEVVRVGFDLSEFADEGRRAPERTRVRRELGIPADVPLVTLVARLVPIKRADRFLRLARRLADEGPAHFLIVGDGESGAALRRSPDAVALGDRLTWAGLRRDIAGVCFASDVVVLTSDNEGTPVSLIEAQAAGLPVVGTRVGGVPSVVLDGRTGRTIPPDDEPAFAHAVAELIDDREMAERMGREGRGHVLPTFSLERLVNDVDDLYRRLLDGRVPGRGTEPLSLAA
jgi:glycosyltransferase involved in cell wall biosynthesis